MTKEFTPEHFHIRDSLNGDYGLHIDSSNYEELGKQSIVRIRSHAYHNEGMSVDLDYEKLEELIITLQYIKKRWEMFNA